MTCGTADGIAIKNGYEKSTAGLKEAAGNTIDNYYQILIKDANHNFDVWNNGAYNFLRLAFGKCDEHETVNVISKTLDTF
jgi:hypothetical protein